METKMDRSQWHFRPNTQDEFIYNEVYVENCYRLPDDMSGIVVVDVGANIGAFTIACLDRGADRVIAVEMDRENYSCLLSNIAAHPLENRVHTIKAALGSKPRMAAIPLEFEKHSDTLLTGGKNIYSSGEYNRGSYGVPVIDSHFIFDKLESGPVWLKLDCEGSEYEILLSDLPWDRIECIFGECHDLMGGKISRDGELLSLNLVDEWANRETIRKRLEGVGYQIELVANPEDPHLSLFFATCGRGEWVSIPELNGDVDIERFLIKEGTIEFDAEYVHSSRTVCILTPFRNARRYLPLYFSQMIDLSYALHKEGYNLRLVAAEGDSLDGTRERLIELAEQSGFDLTLVDTTHGKMKWASVEDPVRLKTMSEVMNKALGEVRESDDIVVWIMSDLKWEPADLLEMIQQARERKWNYDILAPMVFTEQKDDSGFSHEIFYDTWGYRRFDKRFTPQYPYNLTFTGSGILALSEVDSAGSCLVMRRFVAEQCRASDNEAVSFCQMAKEKGNRIAVGWDWKFYHAPLPSRRLLWISDAVCISGFSRVAHAIFPQLVEAGYDLDIIALNYFGEPHNFPYPIYPASVQGEDLSGNLRAKYLIYQAHKEDRPYDLIIKLDDPWNVRGLVRALESLESEYQVPSPPILAWVTVDGKNSKPEELKGIQTIACTEFGKQEILRVGRHYSEGMVGVVPFGVDTSIFHPLDKTEARSLVSSREIPIDAFIVGVVSTNQLRKRLDLVLAYFSAWTTQYQVSNAYLYLCLGPDHNSGFDINSLKDYYGLKNRIIWNPHLLSDQALAMVYNSFDVYLSLSQGEGFGLPALEAMACGAPCVLSDWSAYSSWVPESVAYKIPCTSHSVNSPSNTQSYVIGGVADQQETVGALQKLYLYPELRAKMGKAGVEFACEMTWKQTGDKLIKEIEQVISRADVSVKSESECSQAEGCGCQR